MTLVQLTGWIGQRQGHLSDRVHKNGDEFARARSWTIIRTNGLFGFGARRYRDPRFDGEVFSHCCDEEIVSRNLLT